MRTSPHSRHPLSRRGTAIWTFILGILTVIALGYDLRSEFHWRDESAIISQSYFFDLLIEGALDDPAWVSLPAIDLPPCRSISSA
jgi:hypothetical protein